MVIRFMMLLGFLVVLIGQQRASAQVEPIVRPVPTTGIGTADLGKMLRDIGYNPKSLSPDVFQVTVEREHWPVHVMLSLSTDGQRIWLESKFAPIEDPELVASSAWKGLLVANDKIGPAHFAFDSNDRRVHLYKSIENRTVLKEKLIKEIDIFDRTVRQTQEYWKGENFKPTARLVKLQQEVAPMTIPPVTKPTPPDDSAKLIADWEIVGIEVKGQRTPDKVLLDRKPSLEIRAYKGLIEAKLKTGLDKDRIVLVKIQSFTPDHPQIDFIDEANQIEKGIYKFDGETLTVCFAAPNEPRPTSFKTTEDNRNWLITLKPKKRVN